jgi:phosphate/sulfate permease
VTRRARWVTTLRARCVAFSAASNDGLLTCGCVASILQVVKPSPSVRPACPSAGDRRRAKLASMIHPHSARSPAASSMPAASSDATQVPPSASQENAAPCTEGRTFQKRTCRTLARGTTRGTASFLGLITRLQLLGLRHRRYNAPSAWQQQFRLHRCSVGFGTGRQKMVLERWANPKLSRRTCTCEYGLQSCRGKSADLAKRPRELISHQKPLTVRIATCSVACTAFA